jgi:hypothetical protein
MALRREKQVECPSQTQIALRQGFLKHNKGYKWRWISTDAGEIHSASQGKFPGK